MSNAIIIPLAAILLAGCENEAISRQGTDNAEFRVDKLFTHEGCTIYRFYDQRTVYWTDCRGRTQSSYTTSCGKGCTTTHYDDVETVR